MTTIKQLLSTLLLLTALSSCSQDPLDLAQQPANGTPINLKIKISTSSMTEVTTRAADPNDQINVVLVYCYDDRGIYKDHQTIDLANPVFTGLATNTRYTFVILAAADANTLPTVDEKWNLDRVKQDLVTGQTPTNTDKPEIKYLTEMPKPIFSAIYTLPTITWESAISATGTIYGGPLLLRRNLVKVTIRQSAQIDTSKSGILSATLHNAWSHGYTLRTEPEQSVASSSNVYYVDAKAKDSSLESAVEFRSVEGRDIGPFYTYELGTKTDFLASVLLKAKYNGKEYFYRLAVVDDKKDKLHLIPNYHYIIQINKIAGPGYRKAEEARYNTSTNMIKYSVTVAGGADVVTNGEHYLSLTNSEFLFCARDYAAASKEGITVADLFYSAPASVHHTDNISIERHGGCLGELAGDNATKFNLESPLLPDNVTNNTNYTGKRSLMLSSLSMNTLEPKKDYMMINLTLGELRHQLKITGVPPQGGEVFYTVWNLGKGFSYIQLDKPEPQVRFAGDESLDKTINDTNINEGRDDNRARNFLIFEGSVDTAKTVYLISNFRAQGGVSIPHDIPFTATKKLVDGRVIHVKGMGRGIWNY